MAFGGWGIVFMTVLSMCFLCAVYVLSVKYLKATYQVATCYLENIERECLKSSDRTK